MVIYYQFPNTPRWTLVNHSLACSRWCKLDEAKHLSCATRDGGQGLGGWNTPLLDLTISRQEVEYIYIGAVVAVIAW